MKIFIICCVSIDVLTFLVRASILLDEGVAPTLLQLLQSALCGAKGVNTPGVTTSASSSSPAKQKKDKDKDKNEGKVKQFSRL